MHCPRHSFDAFPVCACTPRTLLTSTSRRRAYYFLATDTPGVMRWLAGEAQSAGAHIALGAAFKDAERLQSGFDLGEHGTTRYLIGADGPTRAWRAR